MQLTRIQKIGMALFIASLLPATLITNWRYDAQLGSLSAMFEKEQALHQSTEKLLVNCEKIATPYDATYQICAQGSQIHERTAYAMALLTEEKASNEIKWYRNFALTVLLINLLSFCVYRIGVYLKRETE